MRLTKELAEKILDDVEEESKFLCEDGHSFSNLYDLREDIMDMDDETFCYHTERGMNDFSNWIRDCLGDSKLADELIGLDKENSLKKIGARISHIEKYLKRQA